MQQTSFSQSIHTPSSPHSPYLYDPLSIPLSDASFTLEDGHLGEFTDCLADGDDHLGEFTDCLADGFSAIGQSLRASFISALESVQSAAQYVRTEFQARCLTKADIENRNSQIATELLSVKSFPTDPKARVALLARQRLSSVLQKLAAVCSHTEIKNKLAKVIDCIGSHNAALTVVEFDSLSFTLREIATNWTIALPADIKSNQQNPQENDPSGSNLELCDSQQKFPARVPTPLEKKSLEKKALKILNYLVTLSDDGWALLAKEKVSNQLEAKYKSNWKLGTSTTTRYGATVGAGLAVGGNIGIAKASAHVMGQVRVGQECQQFIDDATNLVEKNVTSIELGLEGKAEIAVGLEIPKVAKLKAGLEASAKADEKLLVSTNGGFLEWAKAREYVANQFDVLMKKSEHLNDPEIKPYLSRHSLLADHLPSEKKPDAVLLAATRNELLEINFTQLRQKYTLTMALMDKAINDFAQSVDEKTDQQNSSLGTEKLAKEKASQQNSLIPLDDSANRVLKGRLFGGAGKIEITPIRAEASAGIDLPIPGISPLSVSATGSISGAVQTKHMVRQVFADTPLLKRLNELEALRKCQQAFANDPERRGGAPHQVAQRRKREDDTVHQIEMIKNHVAKQSRVFNTISATWKKEEALKETINKERKGTEALPILLPKQIKTFGTDIEQDFQLLKNDFDFYTRLHADIAMRGKKTKQDNFDLREFCERYGASNSNQLVHRMVLANVFLYSKTSDETLKKQLLAFGDELTSPKFAVDDEYLKEHAYFREKVNYTTSEFKFEGEAKLGTTALGIGAGGACKVEWVYCTQEHTDQLRDGDYFEYTFTVTGSLGCAADAMTKIAPLFTTHLSDELVGQALAQISDELTGSFEIGHSKTFRISKPSMFSHCKNFQHRDFFQRDTEKKEYQLDYKFSLPVKVGFDLAVGVDYATSSTESRKQLFHPKTSLGFATLFMHSLYNNFSTKDSDGVIRTDEGGNWKQITQEQKPSLKLLFKNYAAESDNDSISQEINGIGELIRMNSSLDAQVYKNYLEAVNAFKKATKDYEKNPNDDLFEETLQRFEQTMQIYYSHWKDQKKYSNLNKVQPFAPVEHSPTMLEERITASRQQAALAECAGIYSTMR